MKTNIERRTSNIEHRTKHFAIPSPVWCSTFLLLLLIAIARPLSAQTATLYTKSDSAAAGGIAGKVEKELTHALALSRDRTHCYKAELGEGGKSFRFTGLPTGKYDLIFVGKNGVVYEGVELGGDNDKLTGTPLKNMQARIEKQDKFFNKAKIHRWGLIENGEKLLAFVERVRDGVILKQSGEQLMSNLRRFEVLELVRGGDDWTQAESRHVYREEAPIGPGMNFFQHKNVPALGNVRVIDSVKDLGSIALPAI